MYCSLDDFSPSRFFLSIHQQLLLFTSQRDYLTAQFTPSVLAFVRSFPSEEVESIRDFGLLYSVPSSHHCSCDRAKWSGWAPYSSRYVKCSGMYRMLPYLNCTSELSHLAFLGWLSLALQWLSHFCQALTPWFFFFILIFYFSCKFKDNCQSLLVLRNYSASPLIGDVC